MPTSSVYPLPRQSRRGQAVGKVLLTHNGTDGP